MKKTIQRLAMIVCAMLLVGEGGRAADEITAVVQLTVRKEFTEISQNPGGITVDWNGNNYYSATILLSTNPVALSAGAVVTNGWTYWRNLSTNRTASVSFRSSVTADLDLKPGEFQQYRLAAGCVVTNMRAWCNTNTMLLQYLILED